MSELATRLYYIDHHPRPTDTQPPFGRIKRCNLTIIHTLNHSASGIVSLLDPHPFVTNLIEPNDLGRFGDVDSKYNMMYDGWYNRYWKQGDLTSAVNALKWGMDGTHQSLRDGLIREGEELKREQNKYFTSCLETVEVRHMHGHDIAFCRSDKDKSKLANYIRTHVDVDIVCVWGWGKVGEFYVSSWRSTVIDMNTFLRDLGGGGHANACGLKIPVGEENRLLGEPIVIKSKIGSQNDSGVSEYHRSKHSRNLNFLLFVVTSTAVYLAYRKKLNLIFINYFIINNMEQYLKQEDCKLLSEALDNDDEKTLYCFSGDGNNGKTTFARMLNDTCVV